jgi:type VI secretion system protein ImpC
VSEKKNEGGIAGFRVGFDDGTQAKEVSTDRGTFRIVVLSELSPRHDFATSARPTGAHRIDKYTFDERLGEIAGSLSIELADPFDANAPRARCDIRLTDLRSFRPDGLSEAASLLRSLLEARKTLIAVRDGRVQPSDASRSLRRILPREAWADLLLGGGAGPEPPTVPLKPVTGGLDALLDQVEIKKGDPGSVIGALMREQPRASTSVAAAVTRIEEAFRTSMRAVLSHPEFRRLERAWRGVKLLVDRTDQKSGVEIDLVVASREEVLDALTTIGVPDLIVADHEITTDEPVLAMLEAWGAAAEILRAPIVANSSVTLLGFPDIPAMQKSDRRVSIEEADARFRGITTRDQARWLALAVNKVLVRPAYDASTSRFRELPFEEARDAHVFAGGAFVVAIAAAGSWVRNGFASEIIGPRFGAVENLPVRDVEAEGAHYAFPLEHLVSIDTQGSVGRAGLILLGCAPNHDAAVLASVPTLYRGDQREPLQLGDQLFVARLSHAIEQIAAAIPVGTPEAAIHDVTRVALTQMFSTSQKYSAPDLAVAIGKDHLEVTVSPRRYAACSLEEFSLRAPLGG